MIDERVSARASAFADEWNGLLADYPRYRLDFTWPSLGTVDLLLDPIRRRANIEPSDNSLMLGVGAYLAVMWHVILTDFPDKPQPDVGYTEDGLPRIFLRVRGGKYLFGKETVLLDLMPALWEVVRHPKDPFPFFEKTSVAIDLQLQRLPLFALGLFTGLSPYFTGPWTARSDKDLEDYLLNVDQFLARSTAAYYQKTFPSEGFGHEATWYEAGIILPPPHHRQAYICSRSIFRMMDPQFRAASTYRKWIENLSTIPNQLISLPAVLVRVALSDSAEDEKLRMIVQGHGKSLHHLRFALSFARSILGKHGTAEAALADEDPVEAARLLEVEMVLEFFPINLVSPEEIVSRGGAPLVFALAQNSWEIAANIFEAESRDEVAWLTQAGVYYALHGDFSKADACLARVDVTASRVMHDHLQAAIYLAQNRFFDSRDCLKRLFESGEFIELPHRLALMRLLSALYLTLLDPQSCKALLLEEYDLQVLDLPLMMDLLELLSPVNDRELFGEILRKVTVEAPVEPRTVAALVSFLLAEVWPTEAAEPDFHT